MGAEPSDTGAPGAGLGVSVIVPTCQEAGNQATSARSLRLRVAGYSAGALRSGVRAWLALILAGIGTLLLTALLALFIFWVSLDGSQGHFDSAGLPIGRDFMTFWSVAVLAAEGSVLDLFDPVAVQALWAERFAPWDATGNSWAYPPQMLFVIAPLASLDYLWALAAWSLAGWLAYALAARRAALAVAPATLTNLYMGQTGCLVGALFLGALRLAARRPALAGVLCGLVAIKPQLGLMMPVALLAARAWRTALAAACTVAALALASGLAFGWAVWPLWLQQVLPHQTSSVLSVASQATTITAISAANILGLPPWAGWLAQATATTLAALATWWAFSRLRRGLASPHWAFAVLLLSTCLATPHLNFYDLTLASPAAYWALSEWRRGPWTREGLRWPDLGTLLVWLSVWLLPVLTILLSGLPIGSAVLLAALGMSVWRLGVEPPGTATPGRGDEERGHTPIRSHS